MTLKNRLAKLEQSVKETIDRPRVYFADEHNGRMVIPDLNFSGTSQEGHELMKKYPNFTFIVDDIPRQEAATC